MPQRNSGLRGDTGDAPTTPSKLATKTSEKSLLDTGRVSVLMRFAPGNTSVRNAMHDGPNQQMYTLTLADIAQRFGVNQPADGDQ